MREVADGVFFSSGCGSNWILLREGDGLTLIDAGYPGDAPQVADDVRALVGSPSRIRAVLVTHGHVDHIGPLPGLLKHWDVPVLAHPAEVANLRGEAHDQAGPADVLRNLGRPGMAGWLSMVLRNGGLSHVALPTAAPIETDGPLDIPGRPELVLTPGHSLGHAAFLLRNAGILVSGDALITGHPLSGTEGPQMLPEFFARDPRRALATLDAFADLPVGLILPGHGDPWRGTIGDAIEQARARSSER